MSLELYLNFEQAAMLDTVRFSDHFYLHDPSRVSTEKKDPEQASTLTHKPSPPASSLGNYTSPLKNFLFLNWSTERVCF